VEVLTVGATYGLKGADFLSVIFLAGDGIIPFLNVALSDFHGHAFFHCIISEKKTPK
jgi:hypothetical protein